MDFKFLLKQMFIQTCHLSDEHFCCLGIARYLLPLKPTYNVGRFCLFVSLFAFPLTPALLHGKVSEFGKYPEISKHPSFILLCKAVVGADSTNTGTRGFVKHSFSQGLEPPRALGNLMLQYRLQGPSCMAQRLLGLARSFLCPS